MGSALPKAGRAVIGSSRFKHEANDVPQELTKNIAQGAKKPQLNSTIVLTSLLLIDGDAQIGWVVNYLLLQAPLPVICGLVPGVFTPDSQALR
jgi:hypothetical protein